MLITGVFISVDYSFVQSDQELFDCVLSVLFAKSSTMLNILCLLEQSVAMD